MFLRKCCPLTIAMLGVFLMIGSGCTTVEGTGRWQINVIPDSQANQLGLQAYQEILAKEKVSTDARLNGILQRVGQRIAAVVDRPDYEWEFNLIESEQVNAFALPGGKVAVYTGILPMMKNEAGMAAVIGHEVAHVTCRHGGERMTQALGVNLATELASQAIGDWSAGSRDLALQALGVGTQLGMLKYSRTHELEADRLGLEYAAEAGYDPHEAVRLWQRMEAAGGGSRAFEFLSTHPAVSNRIEKLESRMKNATKEYEEAKPKYGLGEDL